jgi:uncharacterized protein (TIGR00661 family)
MLQKFIRYLKCINKIHWNSARRRNNRKHILYAVAGVGKGHAIRSAVIIRHLLKQNHKVLIIASKDSYAYLHKMFRNVYSIDGAELVFENNEMVNSKTFFNWISKLPSDLNHNLRRLFSIIEKFDPDLTITDFEFFSSLVSKILGIPMISIDNIHMITNCDIENDKMHMAKLTAHATIRLFVMRPKEYLITTFFYPKVNGSKTKLFPPVLREKILRIKKPILGKRVLVYASTETFSELADALKNLAHEEFVVYGLNKNARDKNIIYRKFNETVFFRDLAECKSIVCNGGMTLIGEGLHLKKPIFSIPIKNHFEQYLNAYYLEKLGYGKLCEEFNEIVLLDFLSNIEKYHKALKKYVPQDNSKILKEVDIVVKKYAK